MAYEVVTVTTGNLVIRDLSNERAWQFLIVERGGFRELSNSIQAGLDASGDVAGFGEEAPAFAFATDEALSRGLID